MSIDHTCLYHDGVFHLLESPKLESLRIVVFNDSAGCNYGEPGPEFVKGLEDKRVKRVDCLNKRFEWCESFFRHWKLLCTNEVSAFTGTWFECRVSLGAGWISDGRVDESDKKSNELFVTEKLQRALG